MKSLGILIKRNVKLFFKDKGMFFTSLITPAILLVLYVTFLEKVYRDSLVSSLPSGITFPDSLISGIVGGELVSSLLAVSCVTVAFCSNFLMVQDKVNGAAKDFGVSPVGAATLSVSYYFANLITTLTVCFAACAVCFAYLAVSGWYLTLSDALLLLSDVFLLVLFGSALSSVINFFLSSQGQISAVGTVISSGYGFLCGAYMPLSSFGDGLRKVIMFLPGTYGTSLIRNHAMQSALSEMQNYGVPSEVVEIVRDSLDCNLSFFGNSVSRAATYAALCIPTAVLLAVYVFLNAHRIKRAHK